MLFRWSLRHLDKVESGDRCVLSHQDSWCDESQPIMCQGVGIVFIPSVLPLELFPSSPIQCLCFKSLVIYVSTSDLTHV